MTDKAGKIEEVLREIIKHIFAATDFPVQEF